MPRPRKTGLDYFPFDCDFFEDEKIIAIAGEFGIKGEMTAIKLLCAIYRNGYFIEWTEMLKLKMLQRMPGVSAELFDQILSRLVRWGFFDASLFDSVKVLTSAGIQRRYFNIVKRCKKGVDYPHLLVNVTETPVNVTETPVNVTETPVNVTETPQSKEKKINKKESTTVDSKKPPQQSVINFGFDKMKKSRRTSRNVPDSVPTLDEVLDYFRQQDADKRLENWEMSAKLFYDSYNSTGWRDKYGNLIRRWDSCANNWILYREDKEHKEKNRNEQNSINRRTTTENTLADEQYKLADRIRSRRNRQKDS